VSDLRTSTPIAVTGASGALGRLVLDQLLTQVAGDQVIAITRDPQRLTGLGVQVRHGDYDDPASLRTALRHVAVLLLISSPELQTERRVAQHTRVVTVAREAGVQTLVYTSFLGAQVGDNPLTEAHHRTEQVIAESGLSATSLRHPFYTEGFVHDGLREAVASGELISGTAGRSLNTATRADLAAAAVRVLTDEEHRNSSYDLTGPLWNYPDLAAVLSEVSGSPVRRVEATEDLPGAMGWLHRLTKAGALEQQTPDLQKLLGRAPRSLRETVHHLLVP
jgi:NAD(P)H dehydrogenase (quinone)